VSLLLLVVVVLEAPLFKEDKLLSFGVEFSGVNLCTIQSYRDFERDNKSWHRSFPDEGSHSQAVPYTEYCFALSRGPCPLRSVQIRGAFLC
jgi:hypothetical protein